MFNINGRWWHIYFVSPNHPELQRPDGVTTLGSCNNKTSSIYVNDMLNAKMRWRVLCHEITHAAMYSYNVQLNIDQEEILADLVATYGCEIIEITNKIFKKIEGTM